MQTQYIGKLSNNITIDSFLIKQPQYKEYELLYHNEEGELRSYYKGVVKSISYDVGLLTNIVIVSDTVIDEFYTTNSDFRKIENNSVMLDIKPTNKLIYIPILKYITNIGFNIDLNSNYNDLSKGVFKDETIKIININNVNIPFKQIEINNTFDKDQIFVLFFSDNTKHYDDRNNPHFVTATQLGLDKVDNTADMDKPISIAARKFIISKLLDLNVNIESYFKRHTRTIDETKNDLKLYVEQIVTNFTEEILIDAKQALKDVKDLGNIDSLIDNKFKDFNNRCENIFINLNEVFKIKIEAANTELNKVIKLKQDYNDSINDIESKYNNLIDQYQKRISTIERQLSEQATVIRQLRQ